MLVVVVVGLAFRQVRVMVAVGHLAGLISGGGHGVVQHHMQQRARDERLEQRERVVRRAGEGGLATKEAPGGGRSHQRDDAQRALGARGGPHGEPEEQAQREAV